MGAYNAVNTGTLASGMTTRLWDHVSHVAGLLRFLISYWSGCHEVFLDSLKTGAKRVARHRRTCGEWVTNPLTDRQIMPKTLKNVTYATTTCYSPTSPVASPELVSPNVRIKVGSETYESKSDSELETPGGLGNISFEETGPLDSGAKNNTDMESSRFFIDPGYYFGKNTEDVTECLKNFKWAE
ncbi:hypothetical protein PR048_011825 [Dryococelus australis]|uniref:Uncharacterized protein n=1 Tax=Dryococelus australis TaxID=614101 RepID=A0ABQ9HMS5_9NEOP|nr:hypothetical protein PR048_011825 [Dryococelus australis]